MAINKRIAITWQDKEYNILMTMRLVEEIEDSGLNLARIINDCQTGNVKFTMVSRLISFLLNSQGAETTSEEVFSGMFDGEGIEPSVAIDLLTAILGTIFPEPKKKPSISNTKPKAKRKPKAK